MCIYIYEYKLLVQISLDIYIYIHITILIYTYTVYLDTIPMVSQSHHVQNKALLRGSSCAEHCEGVQFLEGHVTHARSLEAKHSFRYGLRGWAEWVEVSKTMGKLWENHGKTMGKWENRRKMVVFHGI